MDKAILLLSHIDESGIEAGHYLAHLAYIDVAHMDFIARLVLMELNQLFLLQKGQLNIVLVSGYCRRFLRLCVDILCLLCFFPFGMLYNRFNIIMK